MPSIDVDPPQTEENKTQETTLSKPIIGIIYPPPEVRNIVDKTASFVARNGPEFEHRIRQNEVKNPKFNFLNLTDAYHAYYQHKVKEFKEGKGQEPLAAPKVPLHRTAGEPAKLPEVFIPKDPPPEYEFISDPASISSYDLDVVKLTAQFVARNGRLFLTTVMQREQRNFLFDFLRPQHSLFYYFTRLVEQYTKILIPPKNLKDLLATESMSYKKVMKDVQYRVEWARFQDREKKKEEDAVEKERVAYAQIDWHDFVVVETVDFQQDEAGNLPAPTTPDEVGARMLTQERIDRGEVPVDDAIEMEVESDGEDEEADEDEEGGMEDGKSGDGQLNGKEGAEKEKDMRKTVVELTPPPLPPLLKPAPLLLEADEEEQGQLSSEDEPDDDALDKDERPPLPPTSHQPDAPSPPPSLPPPSLPPPSLPPLPPSDLPPLPRTPDHVIIRHDYNRKAKPAVIGQEDLADKFLISPITNEKIPAHKVQEHMRIGLLDPKWMEARQRSLAEKNEDENVLAAGSDIDISLKQLAERRTDIFGIGTEETQIGKKIGEGEDKQQESKVVWDGHSGSMEKVSQLARENISIEEQIATIHKSKGLLHDDEKEKIGPAIPKITLPAPPPPPSSGISASLLQPPSMPKAVPLLHPIALPMARPPLPPMPVLLPQLSPMNMASMVVMMQGQQMRNQMGGMGLMGMRPPMPPIGLVPPPQPPNLPAGSGEPPSKKQKTEDSLISEEVFLEKNKGPVAVRVVVPKVSEKPEWNLHGQTLEFTFPLTDTISVLKAKLNEVLAMPAGKQKLQYEGIFVKDSNSLAFYNFTPGAVVHLQMKERGGRKK